MLTKFTSLQKAILPMLLLVCVTLLLWLAATNQVAATNVFVALPDKAPIADTYVASGRPDQSNPVNLKIFWVGHNQTDGFGDEHALLKFAISPQEIPIGSTIQSAKLFLTVSGTTRNDSPLNIIVHRLLSDQWAENITWSQHLALLIAPNNAATVAVSRDLNKQYEWNIQGLVQEWANSSNRIALGLLLDSSTTTGDHERNFWSKDCASSDCTATQRPRLVIEYNPPLATATSTATATPTPTPDVVSLQLKNDPITALKPGDVLTYTITYKTGKDPISKILIANPIPTNVVLVSGSITSSITDVFPIQVNQVITWSFPVDMVLPGHKTGYVQYQVARPTEIPSSNPTPPAENYVIINEGATISWRDQTQEERRLLTSNNTRNPTVFTYLPWVARKP